MVHSDFTMETDSYFEVEEETINDWYSDFIERWRLREWFVGIL